MKELNGGGYLMYSRMDFLMFYMYWYGCSICTHIYIYINYKAYIYILYSTHLHDGFLSLPRAEPVYIMPRFVFWCYRTQESPWGVCWCLVDIE